jgi:hypothetical protein
MASMAPTWLAPQRHLGWGFSAARFDGETKEAPIEHVTEWFGEYSD